MDRRGFIRVSAAVAGGAAVVGPSFWERAYAQPAVLGPGPYGPLSSEPDLNGLWLPEGFTSRIVARGNELVLGTTYGMPIAPDGAGTFAGPGGGWVLVVNSESTPGGASALVFDADGMVVDAYRVLEGTRTNCAGGVTPWGTWLSCEEVATGRVYECDPFARSQGVQLVNLGTFKHEAAAVDPATGCVYLTEDDSNGRFFRFRPEVAPGFGARPDFDRGTLEVASVDPSGTVTWIPIADPSTSTGNRPDGSTVFVRGEGAWHHAGRIYFCCTTNEEVWQLDLDTQHLELLHAKGRTAGTPLAGADNITVHDRSGDLFVTEDGGDMEVVIVSAEPERQAAPFVRVDTHVGSEITGPCFDPAGDRLYFSSQRGGRLPDFAGQGVVYEVSGPFRSAPSGPVVAEVPTAALLPVAAAAGLGAIVLGRRLRDRSACADA